MQSTERYAGAMRWSFGDSPAMADALAALVIAGKKTASCGSFAAYQQDEEKITPGSFHIILNAEQQAVCVIQIVALQLVRFCDVTEEMASKEGEGDGSLHYWQQEHETYFRRGGAFDPEMPLIYEEFRLVEKL